MAIGLQSGRLVYLDPVGNYAKNVEHSLYGALNTAVEVFGYNGEKACRQAVHFMAQSAAKLTRLGAKLRPVNSNHKFAHLLRKEQYKTARQAGKDMSRYFKMSAAYLQQDNKPALIRYGNQEMKLAKIGNVGLGKRAWMWGFGKGKPIPNVIESGIIHSQHTVGYLLRNKLKYVLNALPAGWEKIVEKKAVDRIMGMAKRTIEKRWLAEIKRQRKATAIAAGQILGSFFKGVMR